ncbi:MAG: histone deacetylase family protein [Candidatus Rifleibacteriota bacterium]
MEEARQGGIITFNSKLLEHDPLTSEEEGGRLALIVEQLKRDGLWQDHFVEADIAPMKRLRDIHNPDYLNDLHRRSYSGVEKLDANTPLIKKSFEIARFGAGGVLDAVDAIMSGMVSSALCLTAMPGHHAGISQHGYGSLVNPVAAGAHYLSKKYRLKRVAIIDLDAEHGSGTQEIFFYRKDILTISIHEYPGVTGTGYYDEVGPKGFQGYNLNIPFASGYGDREFKVCFEEIIAKVLKQYKPEFIILAFGTNVLADDPSSHLLVSENGLINIVEMFRKIALQHTEGKIISVLEGGTPGNLMAKTVSQHASLMLNKFNSSVDNGKKEELISYADWYRYAKLVKAQFRKYWKL